MKKATLLMVGLIALQGVWQAASGAEPAASNATRAGFSWAKPLAQDFVVVHQVRDLEDEQKSVCVGTPDIVRLPSGRLIASMELWLKKPNSGEEGGIDYPNHCKIKASDDGGRTWKQISTNGITWGSLFYVKDALYMIGNDPHRRDIRVVRSPDGGKTWSKPTVLFDDSPRYQGSATPVHVKDSFVYRAFENISPLASLVIAGDLTRDLLDPAAWRMSNKVPLPQTHCQEGNVVEIRGQLHVLLRATKVGMTGVCRLEDDGNQMKYRFSQLHPMPGGQMKFKILYDPISQLYWTCSTAVPDPYQDPTSFEERGHFANPENERRILMLIYSVDGLNWIQAGCVAMSKNPLEAFHYSSPLIDGDDLLVLSRSTVLGVSPPRTAGSVGTPSQKLFTYTWVSPETTRGRNKLAHNNHDNNMITFHRVKNFRSLALDLRPDFSYNSSSHMIGPKRSQAPADSSQE